MLSDSPKVTQRGRLSVCNNEAQPPLYPGNPEQVFHVTDKQLTSPKGVLPPLALPPDTFLSSLVT